MRFLAAILLCLLPMLAAAETINVAAAISMKEALVELGTAFEEETGHEVVFSFGASGQLMTQIRNGAPIDAFISAAPAQMDALAKDKLIVDATRRIIGGNKLVVIVPAKSKLAAKSLDDLANANIARVAVGEPKIVPAGQYAVAVMENHKVMEALKPKIVNGQNVRQVLDYVVRGEVDAGFVYQTDAEQAGLKVKKLFDVPVDAHDPIVYPAAVIAASRKQALASKFLDYTKSSRGRWILQNRHGFVVDVTTTKPVTMP